MKVIKFKDFINYEKRIGKMIITGVEGSGKTMLLTRIGIGKMLHGQQDCWKSYDVVDEYNAMGFNFSKNYEHLAFSNIDMNCAGTYIPDRKVYRCSPYRIGLFDEDFETIPYPPYSLFVFTEGYNYLNSYLYNRFRDSFKAFLKTCRQAKIDMVVDTHYVTDICTIFKRLTNRFIHLFKEVEEIKDVNGTIVGHRLFVREWNSYKAVENYENSSGKVQNYEEYELILDKCMYENYDTEFCKYLHLQGRLMQDYVIEHFPDEITIDDLDNFGEEFGITPPEGFFTNNRKISKEESIPDVEEDSEENNDFEF